MPWQLRAYLAAFGRPTTPLRRRLCRLVSVPVLAALAHGCTAVPTSPFLGPDPADASVRTPAVGYRSTIAPFTSRRPVDPAPWREQNEQVAPAPKPST